MYIAGSRDQDQQNAFVRQADELHLADARGLAPWRKDDAGKMSQPGEQVRGAADQLLRLRGVKLPLDGAEFFGRQWLHGEQTVDKEAVATWCRHAQPRCGLAIVPVLQGRP